jgi:hypothetical protein
MQNPSVIRTKTRPTVTSSSRELSWSFILLVIVCTCVVAVGFFFAASQHFTSMDYGIKNSKLREQLRNLEAEKRRLLLAREVASSPLAIRKAARGLGLQQSTSEMAAIPVSSKPTSPKPAAVTAVQLKASDAKPETQKVVRTVLTAPAVTKPNGETRSRIVEAKKDKKEKTEVAALLKLR